MIASRFKGRPDAPAAPGIAMQHVDCAEQQRDTQEEIGAGVAAF
jgi:hypothetical protein